MNRKFKSEISVKQTLINFCADLKQLMLHGESRACANIIAIKRSPEPKKAPETNKVSGASI
jgi:hypothetical protein